ncbi:MAG: VWA domain-containing protein [Candidatus Aminicenantes bacterium]|nr:VWA domain-containing protein [Candidatus Aminicenantes bacterium]
MIYKRPNSFIFFVVFFMSLYAFTLRSQGNIQQQEQQEIPKPSYEVEVIVTNVTVFVTGKDGQRITELKPGNFEIYEDGTLQKLTNFYEIKGMEAFAPSLDKKEEEPSLPPQLLPVKSPQFKNKIIFYIDNWQIHPLNRNKIIKKMEDFITNNFSSENHNNEGMVIALSQKLEVLQEFTPNARLLLRGINEAKKRSGHSLLQMKEKEDLQRELNRMVSETRMADQKYESFQRAMGFAKNYIESEHNDLVYSLKSLNALVDNLAGIEGKKILIYISDGLALNPGEVVCDYIDSAFQVGNARAEAMIYDATNLFKELTDRCNAAEVTLYPINSRGLDSRILSADKSEGWNVYERGSGMIRETSRIKNEALKLMARETGGITILNTNNITPGLERIENDLQFYYSLGYRSLHREKGKYHSIEVKLVGVEEDCDVRVRQGYVRISQEERIKDTVSSCLFLHRSQNPMNVMIQLLPVEPMATGKKRCLKIKFLIPIKNITLYSEGDAYVGRIKAYIALKDSQNRLSPCHELVEDIKIPASDYELALKSSYPYIAEMYVQPEDYIVSLCLCDLIGDVTNFMQFQKKIE